MLLALPQPSVRHVLRCTRALQQASVRFRWSAAPSRKGDGISSKGTFRPLVKFLERNKQHFLEGSQFKEWLCNELTSQAQETGDTGYAAYLIWLRDKFLPTGLSKRSGSNAGKSRSLSEDAFATPTPNERKNLLAALKAAYKTGGKDHVAAQLQYHFNTHRLNAQFSKGTLSRQKTLADLSYPAEWFPLTRCIQRVLHLHVGPTNSGKTYHALQKLEEAKTGVYAGPLRLLAHEIYTRMTAKGHTCDLITGDEMVLDEDAHKYSWKKACTVEMIPLGHRMDVAVIDEIQMMGDDARGWAWTQALLGVKAKEVHLCGEERTVPLIRDMARSMGDELEVHRYDRLTPLAVAPSSLSGDFEKLRKGDCVVCFSRITLHSFKRGIEKATKRRVAIIYGTLPPEIRAQQAKLFNDPDNDYDVLVASDAIGMGLNLAIKRIVFESVTKFNGLEHVKLEDAQIKQIGGRAGRYRTAAQAQDQTTTESSGAPAKESVGLITTLDEADLPIVRNAMAAQMTPMMTARIHPPSGMFAKFAAYFPPSTSLSFIMKRFHELAVLHPRYQLSNIQHQMGIADVIQGVQSLVLKDRIKFCEAPVGARDKDIHGVLAALARCVGERQNGALLELKELDLGILDELVSMDAKFLERLEVLHKSLILYLWLSYRFPAILSSQQLAFHIKHLVEEKIDSLLSDFSASADIQQKIERVRERARKRLRQAGMTQTGQDQKIQQGTEISSGEDSIDVPPPLLVPEVGSLSVPSIDLESENGAQEPLDSEQMSLQI